MTHILHFSDCRPIHADDIPTFPGIYCVLADDSQGTAPPVYIGQAGDISDRIGGHLSDKEEMDEWMREAEKINPSIRHLYVSWVQVDSQQDRDDVEPALVCRLQSVCNDHYKDRFPKGRPPTSINMSGPVNILNDKFTVEPGQKC